MVSEGLFGVWFPRRYNSDTNKWHPFGQFCNEPDSEDGDNYDIFAVLDISFALGLVCMGR